MEKPSPVKVEGFLLIKALPDRTFKIIPNYLVFGDKRYPRQISLTGNQPIEGITRPVDLYCQLNYILKRTVFYLKAYGGF